MNSETFQSEWVAEELARKAAEVWPLVVRPKSVFDTVAGTEPMPLYAALDIVQEVTGDRDDASAALRLAAGAWLDASRPEQPVEGAFPSVYLNTAVSVRGHIIGRTFSFSLAESCLDELRRREDEALFEPGHRVGLLIADGWRLWRLRAERVIALFRAAGIDG